MYMYNIFVRVKSWDIFSFFTSEVKILLRNKKDRKYTHEQNIFS